MGLARFAQTCRAKRLGEATDVPGREKHAGLRWMLPAICFFCVLLPLMVWSGNGSPPVSDRDLLMARVSYNATRAVPKITATSPRVDTRFPEGRGPLSLPLGALMHIYRVWISPQLPSACLYHPSCSSFAIELISEYGTAKGIISTADRLMRCNRMGAVDIHPLTVNDEIKKVVESVELYRIHR